MKGQNVSNPPVEDVRPTNSAANGVHAALDFGDHAAGDRSVGHQPFKFVGCGLSDQRSRIVDHSPQTFDVGEVDELLGAKRLGDRAGNRIGIDVEGLAFGVGADRRHNRDELVVEQCVQDRRIDRLHITDEAEIGVASHSPDETGVLTGDADGEWAVHVDCRDELRIDLADQHHPDDVDGLAIGDAQPVAKLALLAESCHQLADLRPPSVHDDRPHADLSHQHDVLGEQGQGVAVGCAGQGVPSVFDYYHLVGEATNVRQGFDQSCSPVRGCGHGHG